MTDKLAGAAQANLWTFLGDAGQPDINTDSIFPIIKQGKGGKFDLIGTGFFICTQSVFVTATHVLQEVLDKASKQIEPIGMVHFIPPKKEKKGGYIFRPITWAWHSGVADLSIGLAASAHHSKTKQPLLNKVPKLTFRRPTVGEKIVTYAYPNFRHEQEGKVQKLYFRPDFYDGEIIEYYPDGRDKILMPWPCYRTNIHLHGGSSGGPVAGADGNIFGINCRSFEPDTDISFITPIENILDGFLENVRFDYADAPSKISIKEFIERKHIVVE
jgi:hypothetical protein